MDVLAPANAARRLYVYVLLLMLSQDFARAFYPLLVPGTTLLVTDAPVFEENSGSKLTVLSSGNPN